MLKALRSVLTTHRNRLANCCVDSQTRVVFKSAQLRRGDDMGAYRRPIAEHKLVAMLAGKTGTGAPQQAPPSVSDDGGDHEETSGGSGLSDSDAESTDDVDGVYDDIAVGSIFESGGVEAAVEFFLTLSVIRIHESSPTFRGCYHGSVPRSSREIAPRRPPFHCHVTPSFRSPCRARRHLGRGTAPQTLRQTLGLHHDAGAALCKDIKAQRAYAHWVPQVLFLIRNHSRIDAHPSAAHPHVPPTTSIPQFNSAAL